MAAEALVLHVAGMREDGEAIPKPSTHDDLRADPAMNGAVAFLAELREPERTVRINITARQSQIEEIDRRARAKGLTRSSYIVQSAERESCLPLAEKSIPHTHRSTAGYPPPVRGESIPSELPGTPA